MSEAHGTEAWIGLGVETTYGTPPIAQAVFHEFLSESVALKQGRQAKPSLRGVSKSRFIKKKKSVEGGIEAQMQTDGLELYLKHAFGAVNTTGPVASRYTHAFSLAKSLPVGLSIEVNRDSVAIGTATSDLYSGCQISKLTLKQAVEDALLLSAEIIGKDSSTPSVSTPTFPAISLFDWEGFVLSLDTGGGFNPIDVMEFELTIDNNLAADRYKLGQLSRKGLGRGGHRTITGKITKEFDSQSERNLFRNLTQACKVRAVWTYQPDTTKTFTLNVTNLEWTGGEPSADSEGILSLPMEFEARISAAEGDELAATLVNATVSVP